MSACAALLISAPSSGSGKTSVTAALACWHRRCGLRVRCFKTGPDFIDPTILVQASGAPVYNLDPWIMGVDHCRQLLYEAAQNCDLILIEGVMGLFDGEPSSADLARLFSVPILLVIDGSAMAQTFGALVHGLMNYRRDAHATDELRFAGVVANRVGSSYHADLLRASLQPLQLDDRFIFGALPHASEFALPERHLGLQIADEIGDLGARLERLADAIGKTTLAQLPAPIEFVAPQDVIDVPRLLDGVSIAVAFDSAFCFLYQANLEWLRRMGAQLHLFSPLADKQLPEADAVYLPGGYPEMYAPQLADNESMQRSLRAHIDANKPVLAECGGMLYLAKTLVDFSGRSHRLVSALSASAAMGQKLAAIGSQQWQCNGQMIRGHTFHYSTLQTQMAPIAHAQTQKGGTGEAIYQLGSVLASYIHWYFPSSPERIAHWFRGQFH